MFTLQDFLLMPVPVGDFDSYFVFYLHRFVFLFLIYIIRRINKNRTDGEPEFVYFSPHTFATRCFENGMLPKTLQELLGHSSLEMTMDLYTHVTEEMKQKEAAKITLIGMTPIGVKLA